jgi:hypothetical protein
MTGLDRIAPQRLSLGRQVLKEVLERMEPPIDGRGALLACALVLKKLRDIAPGDGTGVLVHKSEKQMKIPPIVIDGVGRIIPSLQIGTEVRNGVGCHSLVSSEGVALRNGGHSPVVLLPFGGVVELRITQGLVERVMAEQLFQDFQRYSGVQQVGGKRVAFIPRAE